MSAWYPCATPGSQSGACTSSAWITGSHASASSRGQLGVDRRQPGLVAEQPPHRDVLLARLAELGPVRDDRRVDVEQPALREEVRARGRRALGRREHDLQRVAVVGRAGVGRARRPRGRRPSCRRRRTRSSPPASPCSSKLFANASRTPSNPGSTVPPTSDGHCRLLRKAEHALAEHVALDLVRAAVDRVGAAEQEQLLLQRELVRQRVARSSRRRRARRSSGCRGRGATFPRTAWRSTPPGRARPSPPCCASRSTS